MVEFSCEKYGVSKNIIKKTSSHEKMKEIKQKIYFLRYSLLAPNIFQDVHVARLKRQTYLMFSKHVRHRNLRNLDIYACHTHTHTLKEYSIHEETGDRG